MKTFVNWITEFGFISMICFVLLVGYGISTDIKDTAVYVCCEK